MSILVPQQARCHNMCGTFTILSCSKASSLDQRSFIDTDGAPWDWMRWPMLAAQYPAFKKTITKPDIKCFIHEPRTWIIEWDKCSAKVVLYVLIKKHLSNIDKITKGNSNRIRYRYICLQMSSQTMVDYVSYIPLYFSKKAQSVTNRVFQW